MKYITQIKVVSTVEVNEEQSRALAPEDAVAFWNQFLTEETWYDEDKEHVVVLMLNHRKMITGFNLVSVGSLNQSMAHPREIFRPVISAAASSFILMHNHPSGDPNPSQADHSVTRKVSDGAEIFDIEFCDHVVVGENGKFYSFRESGLI